MTPIPRHLTDALLDWLITADGVRRVRLEAVCPHCRPPVAGPQGACLEYAERREP